MSFDWTKRHNSVGQHFHLAKQILNEDTGAEDAGGGSLTVSDSDPGAVGAGAQWLKTAQDDQQSFEAFPLFVRNAANDGWIQAGFANAVGPVNIDSWSQDGNIDAYSDHDATQASASIGLNDYGSPRHGVALRFGDDPTQVYDRVNLYSQNTDTISVSMVILRVDPSAAAGIAAPIASLGFRVNGSTGELWLKTGAANTTWTKVA